MQGYLYVADPEGREIAGSRRSLADVERGDGRFTEIENELKRLASEDCTVRWSEAERRLSRDLGSVALSLLFYAAIGWSALQLLHARP